MCNIGAATRYRMCIRPGVKNSYRAALTCMRNIYIYIPYRHVANDEAQYYIHLRLYCRLYVYNYVYPIQIYQIYCTMLAVSAESVTEQRARSRDRRHEASTVGVTATMASAVGAIKLRQSGIVPARSTSTSSFLLRSSLAVAAHSFQTTPL